MKDYIELLKQEDNSEQEYAEYLHELPTQELLDILMEHDCHMGPEDGCSHGLIIDELNYRQKKESVVL